MEFVCQQKRIISIRRSELQIDIKVCFFPSFVRVILAVRVVSWLFTLSTNMQKEKNSRSDLVFVSLTLVIILMTSYDKTFNDTVTDRLTVLQMDEEIHIIQGIV